MSNEERYHLTAGLYILPTAEGAFYATSSQTTDRTQKFLIHLLEQSNTPELTHESLLYMTGMTEPTQAMELLHHCQKLGWVQGVDAKLSAPSGALEDILPGLLNNISESGKILLADDQGFYMANHGFAHETAEELSALSAEISTIHQRRSGVLNKNLAISSHAWAIVDAFGHSQIGFWPIYIGLNRFVIVNLGIPHFNHHAFVNLIWALCVRYAAPELIKTPELN